MLASPGHGSAGPTEDFYVVALHKEYYVLKLDSASGTFIFENHNLGK